MYSERSKTSSPLALVACTSPSYYLLSVLQILKTLAIEKPDSSCLDAGRALTLEQLCGVHQNISAHLLLERRQGLNVKL